MRRLLPLGLLLLLLLLVPMAAYAQAVAATQAMGVLQALQTATGTWAGPLRNVATELFGGLAVITFVLSVGYSFLQGGDVVDMLAIALRQIIYLGFWTFVIQGWPTFGHAIIASFQQAANQAGSIPSSPVDVMNMGSTLGVHIMQTGVGWNPFSSAMLIVVASFAAVIFFIVAGLMLLSMAKSYMVIGAGTLFLGFAGSSYTLDIAQNVFRMTIASGGRLFAIQLIASIGATILRTWIGETAVLSQQDMWSIIGLAVVYAMLVFSIPASIEHMAGGTGHAHAGPGAPFRAIAGGVAGGRAMAAAGNAMQQSLSSSGGGGGIGSAHYSTTGRISGPLPAPGNAAGGASPAATSVGTRMQPPGALYTP
jgi:type IV secretion system protein TrbL